MNWFTSPTPLIIGHRGASADAPENTLKAFHLAIEQGAVGIEFDVHGTADGHIVVIHDEELERTTNGRGRVTQMKLAELGGIDAGAGEPIPTLAQVFAAFGNKILYNVEIKDYSLTNRGTEAAVGRLIAQYGLEENCLVTSFSAISLRRGRGAMPRQTPMGMIRTTGWQQYSYHLFSGQADHPENVLVDARYMAWAKKRNYRVHVWTVDDPREAERLLSLGVHGLITNVPESYRL